MDVDEILEKRSMIGQVFISILLFGVLYFIFLFLFSMIENIFYEVPEDVTTPLVQVASLVASALITFFAYISYQFSYTKKVKKRAENYYSTIQVFKKQRDRVFA